MTTVQKAIADFKLSKPIFKVNATENWRGKILGFELVDSELNLNKGIEDTSPIHAHVNSCFKQTLDNGVIKVNANYIKKQVVSTLFSEIRQFFIRNSDLKHPERTDTGKWFEQYSGWHDNWSDDEEELITKIFLYLRENCGHSGQATFEKHMTNGVGLCKLLHTKLEGKHPLAKKTRRRGRRW